jgi:Holliday junction resolvase RusA-like endonuclease
VLKPNAPLLHTKRPDIDNCCAHVLDALTSAAAIPTTRDLSRADVEDVVRRRRAPGAYITVVDIDRKVGIA